MPKTPSWPTLPLPERPADCRISDWLHRELRSAILENRLAAGARLPSSRSLALRLGISRGTVSAVYEELLAEGYVTARIGDGTRVLPAGNPVEIPQPCGVSRSRPPERCGWRTAPGHGRPRRFLWRTLRPGLSGRTYRPSPTFPWPSGAA